MALEIETWQFFEGGEEGTCSFPLPSAVQIAEW